MKKLSVLTMLLIVLFSACSSMPATPSIVMTAAAGTVIPDGGMPLPTRSATLVPGISPTELKYRILQEFPDFFFCDPDYYPVPREEEATLAQQRFPEIQADPEQFDAILAHHGLTGLTTFTEEQKLLVYRDYKKLNAILFEWTGDVYRFQIQTGAEGQQGTLVTATIDGNGSIDVLEREQSFPTCPICLARGTRIDTPRGAVRVEELQVGDSVWTANEAGERVAAILVKIGSVPVTQDHEMLRIRLEDGRELWSSPGHPSADGRTLGSLKVGDLLDGAAVIELERVPYEGQATFDILPSGETGWYWANGILIGSTLPPDV